MESEVEADSLEVVHIKRPLSECVCVMCVGVCVCVCV